MKPLHSTYEVLLGFYYCVINYTLIKPLVTISPVIKVALERTPWIRIWSNVLILIPTSEQFIPLSYFNSTIPSFWMLLMLIYPFLLFFSIYIRFCCFFLFGLVLVDVFLFVTYLYFSVYVLYPLYLTYQCWLTCGVLVVFLSCPYWINKFTRVTSETLLHFPTLKRIDRLNLTRPFISLSIRGSAVSHTVRNWVNAFFRF